MTAAVGVSVVAVVAKSLLMLVVFAAKALLSLVAVFVADVHVALQAAAFHICIPVLYSLP